jgi:hypothetical protein
VCNSLSTIFINLIDTILYHEFCATSLCHHQTINLSSWTLLTIFVDLIDTIYYTMNEFCITSLCHHKTTNLSSWTLSTIFIKLNNEFCISILCHLQTINLEHCYSLSSWFMHYSTYFFWIILRIMTWFESKIMQLELDPIPCFCINLQSWQCMEHHSITCFLHQPQGINHSYYSYYYRWTDAEWKPCIHGKNDRPKYCVVHSEQFSSTCHR